MNKEYIKPDIELVEFDIDDILTTSDDVPLPDDPMPGEWR